MPFEPATDAPSVTRETMEEASAMVARLVKNEKAWASSESGGDKRLVWNQVWERLDAKWSDGNPVLAYNTPTLIWADGRPSGKGSEAYKLADAFIEKVNESLMPDEGGDKWVGQVFRLVRTKTGENKNTGKEFFGNFPVEHLGGEEYKYDGHVMTLESQRESNGASGEPIGADDAHAGIVASLLDGMSEEEIRAGKAREKVTSDPNLGDVQTVLNMSLRGGLVQGKLLDRLVEAGYMEIKDGVALMVQPEGVPA